jgi:hypothetical protein
MGDVPILRRNVKEEEIRYRAAISENTFYKIGGAINFINERAYLVRDLFANGRYASFGMPQTSIDGFVFFEYDVELLSVWCFNKTAGSGGFTEFDLKRYTAPGGVGTSIFSTTPKIYATTGNNQWVNTAGIVTATPPNVQGVLSVVNLNAGDALGFDILTAQSGNPKDAGVVIHFRPR